VARAGKRWDLGPCHRWSPYSFASNLGDCPATLHRLAQAGIVTPTRVDQHGSRWWDLRELRRQIDDYLGNSGGGKPTFG
jgi:hypothetical protein